MAKQVGYQIKNISSLVTVSYDRSLEVMRKRDQKSNKYFWCLNTSMLVCFGPYTFKTTNNKQKLKVETKMNLLKTHKSKWTRVETNQQNNIQSLFSWLLSIAPSFH